MGLYRDGAGNDRGCYPQFVVAPLLVMIFAIILHWLPGVAGMVGRLNS